MMLHHGDCLDVMAGMEPESVDAIVTDPPYDLTSTGLRNGSPRSNPGSGPYARLDRGGFMGKVWDGTGIAFRPETWAACLRVAKPSSYLLAFGGTRTVHRMTVALEDAGWIIRDMLVWAYASGFPKSKASLKPAWEPIVMARKPGPLRMLAIDECRIPTSDDLGIQPASRAPNRVLGKLDYNADQDWQQDPAGRWPANVILTDPIFDGGIEGVMGGGESVGVGVFPHTDNSSRAIFQGFTGRRERMSERLEAGTYSRFFLIPKADRTDREPVLRTDRELAFDDFNRNVGNTVARRRENHHPTVKPVDLMRHLVRLVTPSGGIVLDPFLGSGTTAIAAEMEGFEWIGIEKEAEYVAIAEARLNGTQRGLGLGA